MTIVPPPWVAELAGQHWKPAGLAVTVLLLAWLTRRAVKSGQPDRWLAAVALLVGLAWSGEAMWEVATQKLHVGTGFAVAAFAVFEVQLATAMMRAERHRGDRRRRDRHIRAAWRVALVMGCVVVWAADSPVEVALRPAIPLLLVSQWKVGLTDEDDGTGPAESSSWIWTPQKVGVALGLLKPGDESLSQAQVRQQIDRMVKAADTIALAADGGVSDKAAAKARLRLRTLARTATEQMVAEVARRQRQAALAETLMVNPGGADHSEMTSVQPPRSGPNLPVLTAVVGAPAMRHGAADARVAQVSGAAVPGLSRRGLAQPDAQVARRGRVVMTRPVNAAPVDRDAALRRAVDRVLTHDVAVRQAARDECLPESTLRREVNKIRGTDQVNGASVAEFLSPAGGHRD